MRLPSLLGGPFAAGSQAPGIVDEKNIPFGVAERDCAARI